MKIHLLIIEFTLLLSSGWCEKRTKQEDEQRSSNCGTSVLPTGEDGAEIETEEDSWLVRVSIGKPGQFDTAGSFISDRHVITSSQVILDWQDMWTTDGRNADIFSNCKKSSEIPVEQVNELKITSGECKKKDTCKVSEYTAEKAWILYCTSGKEYATMYAPMLIETKEKTSNFACFQINITDLTTNDKLELYGIEYTDENNIDSSHSQMKYRFKQFKELTDKFVLVGKFYSYGDRGGPAILRKGNKTTVVAIGGSTGFKDNALSTYYWWNFRDTLCEHSGICASPTVESTTASRGALLTGSQESSTSEEPETVPDESTVPSVPDPEDEREAKAVYAPDSDDDEEDGVTAAVSAEKEADDGTDMFVGDDFFNAATATSWTTIFSLLCAFFF